MIDGRRRELQEEQDQDQERKWQVGDKNVVFLNIVTCLHVNLQNVSQDNISAILRCYLSR